MPSFRLLCRLLFLSTLICSNLSTVCGQSASAQLPVDKAQLQKTRDTMSQLNASDLLDTTFLFVQSQLDQLNGIVVRGNQFLYRSSKKMRKTILRLARWEIKLKKIIHRLDPHLEQQLFANENLSFSKIAVICSSDASAVSNRMISSYSPKLDELVTLMKYLDSSSTVFSGLSGHRPKFMFEKADSVEQMVMRSQLLSQQIKARKEELVKAMRTLIVKKSKAMRKINDEIMLLEVSLTNFESLFTYGGNRLEKHLVDVISKTSGFKTFFGQQSIASRLFPASSGSTVQIDPTLQSRMMVASVIGERIGLKGSSSLSPISQQLESAQAFLASKNADPTSGLAKKMSSSGDDFDKTSKGLNNQRARTFKQRLEWGNQFQFRRQKRYTNISLEIGANVGYKLNDKTVLGLNCMYRAGLGSVERIRFNSLGFRLGSFVDYRITKKLFLTNNFELMQDSSRKDITARLSSSLAWYKEWNTGIGLMVPLTRSGPIKQRKRSIKIQLLYDMLNERHLAYSQRISFRVGYVKN